MKPGKIILFAALAMISIDCTVLSQVITNTKSKKQKMETTTAKTDTDILYELNVQFIKNFISMDTLAHNEIIHKNFTCINGDGSISGRKEYMEGWAKGYANSGYTSFSITDENIRLFGDMALVRSRTIYTKEVNGETIQGSSVYTDTYIKENGRWWCVQAHITPVKK